MKSLNIPKGGNQNPYIEDEQTAQLPKEKVQKDKQRSTKHTHKTLNKTYIYNKRSSNTNPTKKTGVNSGTPEG